MVLRDSLVFEDTRQESAAEDPSLSNGFSLVTDNLPLHLHIPLSCSVFGVHANCDASARLIVVVVFSFFYSRLRDSTES